MLNQDFITNGFCFIQSQHYLNTLNKVSLNDLYKVFDGELKNDGGEFRKRAYLKLQWSKKNNTISIPSNQNYFQTAASNKVDGGKIRQFQNMTKKVLDIPIVSSILKQNFEMMKECSLLKSGETFTIGLHFIRYLASEKLASYSSPDWLHKDDEPLVFVHLIQLDKNALGGDNLIANNQNKQISHVIRLEESIDTLVLNRNVYHAVTPLGSRKGTAVRDVILFTVEPDYTQQENCA